jgi:ketosteroid isomerase-like protein
MSQENAELARRASEMFNRRDLHGFMGLMAMDVTFQPQLGASSHGHDEIRRLWDALIEGSDLGAEVVEIRDLGADLVLAAVRERGRDARSGVRFEQTVWVPSRWLHGECVWWGVFLSEHDALQALGVSE